MSRVTHSVAMSTKTHRALVGHLLQHYAHRRQEDLCFALWRPSQGRSRLTALVSEIILPEEDERKLHGNVSFEGHFFERALAMAIETGAGLVFLHSHPSPGWQGMSRDDVVAEERLAPRVFAATGHPLLGMTLGTDEAWSGRFWFRRGRGQYERQWCGSVRTVGDGLNCTFHEKLAPPPPYREELRRTTSAWGEAKQRDLARLRIGVIGAGSVGGLVAEATCRQGTEDLMLIDFDIVKKHNLDRLVHATPSDIGNLKVETSAARLAAGATSSRFRVEALPLSITKEDGFRAALDCDVLFSCVDRPWPRYVLNTIATAHLIPVIDGGVRVSLTAKGNIRGADWRAHAVLPGHECLACIGQYDPADVALERTGLLDDPTYIACLPQDHPALRNENVFSFGMNAAGLQMLQFLSMVVRPGGMAVPGPLNYHFANASLDRGEGSQCKEGCYFPDLVALGDHSPFDPLQV
jgi:molybdopterin-synthase adenylyltransferase